MVSASDHRRSLDRRPVFPELRIQAIFAIRRPDEYKPDREMAFDRIGFRPVDFALVFRNIDAYDIFGMAFHDLPVADVVQLLILPGFVGLETEIIRKRIPVMVADAEDNQQEQHDVQDFGNLSVEEGNPLFPRFFRRFFRCGHRLPVQEFVVDDRQQNVRENNQRKTCILKENEQQQANGKERQFEPVAFQTDFFHLQRKQRNFRIEHTRAENRNAQQKPGIDQDFKQCERIGMFQNQRQTQDEQRIGRRRKPDERIGLARIDVEIRQPVTRPERNQKTQVRKPRSDVVVVTHHQKHDEARRNAAGDHVGQ